MRAVPFLQMNQDGRTRRRFLRPAGLQKIEGLRISRIARLRAFLRGVDRLCDLLLLPGKRVGRAGDEQGSQFVYLAFKLLLAFLFPRLLDEAAVAPIENAYHSPDRRNRAKTSP